MFRDNWFGPVPIINAQDEPEYETGVWPIEGIFSYDYDASQYRFHYAMETPIALWSIRYPTHIETGLAVFQLGGDQLCILDPNKKQIALIARGTKPLVVKNKPPSTPN